MRRLIALAVLVLASCTAATPARKPHRDPSSLPVYSIEEPFRVVEEWTIRIKLPALSGTLVRVWEVDDGDGWMSVDATSNQPLSEEEANFAAAELFALVEDSADARGLKSVLVEVCWQKADADETCGGDEYVKSAVAGWTRK